MVALLAQVLHYILVMLQLTQNQFNRLKQLENGYTVPAGGDYILIDLGLMEFVPAWEREYAVDRVLLTVRGEFALVTLETLPCARCDGSGLIMQLKTTEFCGCN